MAEKVVVIDNDRHVCAVAPAALDEDGVVAPQTRTRHENDSLQAILDHGRFGFWMIMLRAPTPGTPPVA